MHYHTLKAGECPGTYVVTGPVTEQDLLRIANQIAQADCIEAIDARLHPLRH